MRSPVRPSLRALRVSTLVYGGLYVSGSGYNDMNFRDATDRLIGAGVSLRDDSAALGASYAAVKQARMDPRSGGYGTPPPGWEQALARLARGRSDELEQLAVELDR